MGGDGLDLATIVPVVFLAGGALTIVRVVAKMLRERRFLSVSTEVDGEVTDVREYRRRRGSGNNGSRTVVTYSPVVRFPLPDGRVVDAEVYEESSSSPRAGTQVAVRYDPGDPTYCRLDGGDLGRWGGHATQLVLSVVFIGVALLFLGVL